MSRKKRIAADLALALAGVAIAFLVAEAAVRVSGLAKPSLYTWDAYRGWGLKPGASGWQRDEGAGFVRVNRAGFRGPEWTIAKPPDALRIAVVGDSFTEAPQVAYDETFCAVAEHALGGCNGLSRKRVQVMDFGTDAYGTAQELVTLRRHVWQYSPDLVVLAFFLATTSATTRPSWRATSAVPSTSLTTASWCWGDRSSARDGFICRA